LISPSQKTIPWKLPKLEVSIGGWSAFPLDEKEKNFGQSMKNFAQSTWDKNVRTYWGTCWKLGKPLGNRKKLKIFLSPQPKFEVPRVEIGPIESTLHVNDFCVLFRHYYKQDTKYSLMNFVFGQSKGIFWEKVSKLIKPFS
jgi:hypothetical protein